MKIVMIIILSVMMVVHNAKWILDISVMEDQQQTKIHVQNSVLMDH